MSLLFEYLLALGVFWWELRRVLGASFAPSPPFPLSCNEYTIRSHSTILIELILATSLPKINGGISVSIFPIIPMSNANQIVGRNITPRTHIKYAVDLDVRILHDLQSTPT